MAGKARTGRRKRTESFFDYSLLIIVIFLLSFGLIMVYSASSYEASVDFNDSTHYLKSQLRATVIGIVILFGVARIDYHFWRRFAIPAYLVSVVLVLLVLTPLGIESHGARRWLNLGLSLQPAEVAKVGMIIFFASVICKIGKQIETPRGFLYTIGMATPISIMVLVITSNLSSAIIIFAIVFLMLFVASSNYKYYVLGAGGFLSVAALVVFVVQQGIIPDDISYRLMRVKTWLNPEAYASDTGFQTLQALYSIGSGGIFGKGLGQSMQKLGFLPEAQNDMIFSIICEELGLFGATAIILLFVLLIWRMMVVANNAPDLFGALLVVGVMGHIAVQVILNIGVVTNSIPNTGITLPFISYGGSSILFLLIEIGMVLSVSRGIRLE